MQTITDLIIYVFVLIYAKNNRFMQRHMCIVFTPNQPIAVC